MTTTFTIRDTGGDDLGGLGISIDGTDAADFAVTTAPVAPVAPGGSTTFTVRFAASSAGAKAAALHLRSNVTGTNNRFDITLTGTGLTANQNWLQQTFGTTGATGDAAPTADPNGNGFPNIIEYALGGDPIGNSTGASILPTSGIDPNAHCMAFSLTRYLDRNDITLTVQAADSLAGPWTNLARSTNGAAFTVLVSGATVNETGSGDTRSVTVCDVYQVTDPAHPKRFMRLEVTGP